MTNNVASEMTILGAPVGLSETQDTLTFRLRKSFAVVHFEPSGKGLIVFLPEGAELRVVGSSRLAQCCEVLCENQLYNIFEVDLLGPWSMRLRKRTTRPVPAKAVAACA